MMLKAMSLMEKKVVNLELKQYSISRCSRQSMAPPLITSLYRRAVLKPTSQFRLPLSNPLLLSLELSPYLAQMQMVLSGKLMTYPIILGHLMSVWLSPTTCLSLLIESRSLRHKDTPILKMELNSNSISVDITPILLSALL